VLGVDDWILSPGGPQDKRIGNPVNRGARCSVKSRVQVRPCEHVGCATRTGDAARRFNAATRHKYQGAARIATTPVTAVSSVAVKEGVVHTHHPVDDAKGNAEALLEMRKMGLKISF